MPRRSQAAAAVDVLRAHGVLIDAGIMAKVFAKKPSTKRAASTAVDETRAIEPTSGQKVGLLAVVRDLLTDTKNEPSQFTRCGGLEDATVARRKPLATHIGG